MKADLRIPLPHRYTVGMTPTPAKKLNALDDELTRVRGMWMAAKPGTAEKGQMLSRLNALLDQRNALTKSKP